MPAPLPIYFRHNRLAVALYATSDRQIALSLILKTLNRPGFSMLESLEDVRVILHFLPKVGLPLEELSMAINYDVETIPDWITGALEPTRHALDLMHPVIINRLSAIQNPGPYNT